MKIDILACLLSCLQRFFLKKNTLPPFMIIFEHCVEILAYLFIVHVPETTLHIFTFSQTATFLIVAILSSLILLRTAKGISFIKVFFPVTLFVTVQEFSEKTLPTACPIIFLLVLLLTADISSNTKLDFSPLSINAETVNSSKILHALLLVFGVIQTRFINNSISFLALGGGFAILAAWKAGSIMRNDQFKELMMRIYFLLSMDHLVMALCSFVTLPLVLRFLMPVVVSQFLFELYTLKRKKPKLEELYSQEKYFELSFSVCKYLNDGKFSRQIEEEICSLAEDRNVGQMEFMKEQEKNNLIYEKLVGLLTRVKSFQGDLLLAEIHTVCHHRLLKSRHLIESLKKRSDCSPNQKLLIYRLEELVDQCFKKEHANVYFDFEENFYECDEFRSMLLKSTVLYINFWEYSLKGEIETERLRQMGDRIVDMEDMLTRKFETMEMKCITICLLYISYQYKVSRDIKSAKKILQKISFNEENMVNFDINERIFIQIGLEAEDRFRTLKVGSNVSLLLGYERKEIEGQIFQIFLPEFFHRAHDANLDKTLEDETPSLHLFNKKTIIKNKLNYYEECNIAFRLHYNLGECLTIQGFLHIKNNPQYLWTDFLFVNEADDILECSQNFSELVPSPNKFHKAEQFFTDEVDSRQPNFHNEDEYYPLVILNLENDCVTYFVRRNAHRMEVAEVTNEKLVGIMNRIKYFPLDFNFRKSYFSKMKKVLEAVFAKQYTVLLVAGLVIIGGVFLMEGLFYSTMSDKQNHQNLMINKTSDLIHYANNFTEMGLLFCYTDMNRQIGYSNDFTFPEKLVEDSLKLQLLNERLKDLSIGFYQIPSASLKYDMSPYEITLQFASSLYMLENFNDDLSMVNLIANRMRKSLMSMWLNTFFKLRNNYLSEIDLFPEKNATTAVILLSGIFLSLVVIFILMTRTDLTTRRNEQETLSVLVNAHCQEELIKTSKMFVGKITREEIRSIKQEYPLDARSGTRKEQTSFAPDLTATDRENMKSETSMRELSNRNLMDETLNKSLFLQSKLKSEQEKKVPLRLTEIKLGRGKVRHIVVPLVLVLAITALLVVNLVNNGIIYSIDEKLSAGNIFTLYRQSGNLSLRLSNFFSYLNLRLAGFEVDSSVYKVLQSDFARIQGIVVFEEVKLPQFSLFQDRIIKLQYHYLCTFMHCDSQFEKEINIIYVSTIEKLFNLINYIIDKIQTMDQNALRAELTSEGTKYNLDMMYYSEMLIRQCLTEILDIYDQCYLNYSHRMRSTIFLQSLLAILTTVTGVFLWVLFQTGVYRNQQYLSRILDLFRVSRSEEDLEEQLPTRNEVSS